MLELPLQLPSRQPDLGGNGFALQRFLQRLFHQRMARRILLPYRPVLVRSPSSWLSAGARTLAHQQVHADFPRQITVDALADPAKQHVQGRGGAGTGHALTFQGIQLRLCMDPRIAFLETLEIVPMHRRFITVEHPGSRQQFGAGFHPRQHRTEQRLLA